ncbi:alanyl-tRNA synthetase [Candidatus Phytoplasma luffae]|uniref:Alanine--tRNA ligase n=1 Tax=Loofah witches'-broom phytoplasma TaxID=35773 RepID=A0A975FIY9_LOWBP|nr:alanine--tRNA ligase [Candidatus Phytoplasma luffae]QTX02667.1 alanyl-tRNA synthetase [Candidatus Phytoplasma luffae]
MKKMSFMEIKQKWLDFFLNKGHHLEKSVSLIPDSSDPSLLWVNAGVIPLKKYLDGSKKALFTKIVNIQKCLRTNDIENVGTSMIHHTFFEMLGNFSIGDYFKKESIDLAYEFLFSDKWLNLSKNNLYITYFYQDKETYNLWLKKGIDPKRLIPLKTNFWEIGEGPCGPCTEIFFDRGSKYDERDIQLIIEDIPNNRFIEVWNIVFSEYNSVSGIKRENYKELPIKNIDTGAGLERLACIFQNTETTFETDLFLPIIEKITLLSGLSYYERKENFRIIADHIKTLVFGIGDGVSFSNIGRGYVLKKILRRAFLKGKKINLKKPFLFKLVSVVIDIMEKSYPYLRTKQNIIENMIQLEEEKFLFNLNKVKKLFIKFVSNNVLSGINFFKLYDTYGLPKDLIIEYAHQNNILIDDRNEEKFDIFLEKQKQLSRERSNINSDMNKQNNLFLEFKEKSDFIGYEIFENKTQVLKIFPEGIVLKQTPFLPLMGGQNSDSGKINDLEVDQVIKLPNNQFLHKFKKPFKKFFLEGKEVIASIDISKRKKSSLNHTAVHLLHDALKLLLDNNFQSRSSALDFESLRLDFTYSRHFTFQDLMRVENKVNEWINQKHPVIIQHKTLAEAINQKIPLLSNKIYPEIVRVVRIGDFSIQLCGGTHAKNTSELKRFFILNYKVIGSGVYRIEASSGDNIFHLLKEKINPLLLEEKRLLTKLKEAEEEINDNVFLSKQKKIISPEIKYNSYQDIQNYKNHLEFLQKYLNDLKQYIIVKQNKYILSKADSFIPEKIEKEMMIVIQGSEITTNMLKILLEHLFKKMNNDFLCICHKQIDKFMFLCKSKRVHVGNFIKKINKLIIGRGGGNNQFGQSCSNFIDKFDQFQADWKLFL